MLTRIDIAGYRGFQEYQLSGLSRVNLLVGKNNCGKTTLLESVHFLASGGDPQILTKTAARRGELSATATDERAALDFSHFFHGHEIRSGSQFEIKSDNSYPRITVAAVSSDEIEGTGDLFEADETLRPPLILKIECGGIEQRPIYLSERGSLITHRRFQAEDRRVRPTTVFISPDSLLPSSLGAMWRQVVRDKSHEAEVKQAMRILEKNLDDIVFEPTEPAFRSYSERAGFLVSFDGDTRRFPLGSMGDGMRRLLSLAISLINVKDGLLIIDEIDTGFHYSVMAEMWKLVVKTAIQSNIQVFATTHSWDCIEGLSQLCQREADLMQHVSVQKIDRAIPRSIGFSGESIVRMVKADIDPR